MSQGQVMKDWIATIVRELGPRRPGTAAEARAAERVAEAFWASCDEVRIEPVSSRHESFFGLLKLLAVGYTAAFVLTFLWPGLALVLVVLLGTAFALTSRGHFVVDPLFSKTRTQNVVGVIRPSGERRRLLLFAGHHDSPILMPLWRPERKKYLPYISTIAAVGLLAQILFSLGALMDASKTLLVCSGLVACSGLAALLLLTWGILGWHTPCSGANDNLSSVAVVAALGRELAKQRPQSTEVWLISFGCEEEGRFGSRDFAARYAPELEDGVLINMETVGAGEISIIRSERLSLRRSDPAAVKLVLAAARRAGLEVPVVELSFGHTDMLSFREEGLSAVTVFGRDATGLFSLWHAEEDQPENLDAVCLERALTLCRSIVALSDEDKQVGGAGVPA